MQPDSPLRKEIGNFRALRRIEQNRSKKGGKDQESILTCCSYCCRRQISDISASSRRILVIFINSGSLASWVELGWMVISPIVKPTFKTVQGGCLYNLLWQTIPCVNNSIAETVSTDLQS